MSIGVHRIISIVGWSSILNRVVGLRCLGGVARGRIILQGFCLVVLDSSSLCYNLEPLGSTSDLSVVTGRCLC
jgi:hypothetical protein